MALLHDEAGLSTLEYVIVLVLVAVLGILSWQLFGASVADSVDEAQTELTHMGVGGGGRGGAARAPEAGDGVEAVGEADPAHGGEAPPAGAASEEQSGASGGEGGRTKVVGVVRDEGSMSVYEAPGTDEESGGYGVLLTFLLVLLLGAGGVFAFFKAKGGSKG